MNTVRALAVLVCILCARPVLAQATDPIEYSVAPNYSYAVFVGSGVYTLDDRRVYVARMGFSWHWKEADAATGDLGVKFLLPVTVGITNFEDFEDLPDLTVDDISTLSFVPGVELEFALSERFSVKPFAQAGVGLEFQDKDTTFVWGAGVRSRYTKTLGKSDWILGGELMAAGNVPGSGVESSSIVRAGFGVEHVYPLAWEWNGRRTTLHTQLIGYHYPNEATFDAPASDISIDNTIQLGMAIGIDPAFKFLGISVRQVGVGYKHGNDISAITLVTSFPF